MINGSHFIFNNIDSRDYEVMLCSFDGSSDEELPIMELEPIRDDYARCNVDYGAKCSDVLTFGLSITHDETRLGEPFSRSEKHKIINWLMDGPDLKWLTVYNEEDRTINYLCRVTNITEKRFSGNTIGFICEITCDSAYAYSDIITHEYNFNISDYNEEGSFSDDIKDTISLNVQTEDLNKIIFPKVELTSVPIIYDELDIIHLTVLHPDTEESHTLKLSRCYGSITIDTYNKIIFANGSARETYEEDILDFFSLKEGVNTINIDCQYIANLTITISYREKYKAGVF